MPDPIFFQSANRFLAASPSGDFSLYGAQPTVQVSPAAPASDPADTSAPHDTVSDDAMPVSPANGTSQFTEARLADLTGDGARAGTSSAPAATAFQAGATAEPAHLAASPLNPFDLRPIVLTNLQEHDSPVARHADGGSADPTGGAHADLPAAAPDVGSMLAAPVLDTVEPIVGDTVGTVVGLVDPVLETVTGVVGDTINTVVGAVDPLLDTVGSTVEGTLDTLTGTVDGVTTPLLTTLGEVGHVADDLPVTDLLGSDPAGGIATLVNLVNVTDLLDLREAGAPADPGQTGGLDPVGGLLDTLTTDLTDLTHHDGAASTDHDTVLSNQNSLGDLLGDHHDGGLGLGLGG